MARIAKNKTPETGNSALIARIKAASKLSYTNVLTESLVFEKKESVVTSVPALNIALSGDVRGGLNPGILQICGPSKHFKSLLGLIVVKSYLEKFPDAVCLFFDSEFGMPEKYFNSLGIDASRVIHCPVTNVEEFKFEIMEQLSHLQMNDNVILFLDSLGNLASKKEVDDALSGSSAADMTRAKQIKSVFRMITPHLSLKKIPLVVINHIYMEMGLYPKAIVSGGTGSYLSSDNIWIIGRQQEKDGKELTGFNFIINIEKSRHVVEKSKIPISVDFETGLNKWSGLLEIATELGHVTKPSPGWYTRVCVDCDKRFSKDKTNSWEFWKPVFETSTFLEDVRKTYVVSEGKLMQNEDEIDG